MKQGATKSSSVVAHSAAVFPVNVSPSVLFSLSRALVRSFALSSDTIVDELLSLVSQVSVLPLSICDGP